MQTVVIKYHPGRRTDHGEYRRTANISSPTAPAAIFIAHVLVGTSSSLIVSTPRTSAGSGAQRGSRSARRGREALIHVKYSNPVRFLVEPLLTFSTARSAIT